MHSTIQQRPFSHCTIGTALGPNPAEHCANAHSRPADRSAGYCHLMNVVRVRGGPATPPFAVAAAGICGRDGAACRPGPRSLATPPPPSPSGHRSPITESLFADHAARSQVHSGVASLGTGAAGYDEIECSCVFTLNRDLRVFACNSGRRYFHDRVQGIDRA